MYALRLARSARKEFEALPDAMLARVAQKFDALVTNPRPVGCKKLRGADDLWRIRVGDFRIVYRVDDRPEARFTTIK